MARSHRAFALAAPAPGCTVLLGLSHLLGEALPDSPHPDARMPPLPLPHLTTFFSWTPQYLKFYFVSFDRDMAYLPVA